MCSSLIESCQQAVLEPVLQNRIRPQSSSPHTVYGSVYGSEFGRPQPGQAAMAAAHVRQRQPAESNINKLLICINLAGFARLLLNDIVLVELLL